ncbi:MAG: efflux RND transporter periplasmic adaptor subunit [Balneolales bacterium]
MLKQISFLLAIILLAISCNDPENSESSSFGNPDDFSNATSVEVSTVQRSEISKQIRSYGTVRAQDVVNVNPQISERIIRIEVDLGDTVAANQVIAKLHDVNYRDQLKRDQAEHRQRKITLERDSTTYDRQRELYDRQLISPSEHDEAWANFRSSIAAYESSLASLTQSSENLKNTEIRSPVNGVIKDRLVSEGDLASTGQTMFEVANLAGYEVRLFIPLRDWKQTKIGQNVDIRNSGDAEFSSQGVITRKSPGIDDVTGLGQVVVSISQTGGELYSGALTESRIYIETRPNAIVIPRIALLENVQTVIDPESNSIELERTYSAFIVQGDTLAQRRDLELGFEQGDRIEVLNGLESGEQIIITGQIGLEDQSKVRPTSLARDQEAGSQPDGDIEGRREKPDSAGRGQRGSGNRPSQ